MSTLKADRRLYVTADRSEIVEENDPRSAFLLCAAGLNIGAGDVARYKLKVRAGKIVYPGHGLKAAPPPPEHKMIGKVEDKEPEVEEWNLKTSPEDYLKRSPDGPNAELARRILGG
jgi:hypothetical protein